MERRIEVLVPETLLDRVGEEASREVIDAWIREAIEQRLKRDALSRYLADYQAEFGTFTEDEMAPILTKWQD